MKNYRHPGMARAAYRACCFRSMRTFRGNKLTAEQLRAISEGRITFHTSWTRYDGPGA